jgi:hypothetical protein
VFVVVVIMRKALVFVVVVIMRKTRCLLFEMN